MGCYYSVGKITQLAKYQLEKCHLICTSWWNVSWRNDV